MEDLAGVYDDYLRVTWKEDAAPGTLVRDLNSCSKFALNIDIHLHWLKYVMTAETVN